MEGGRRETRNERKIGEEAKTKMCAFVRERERRAGQTLETGRSWLSFPLSVYNTYRQQPTPTVACRNYTRVQKAVKKGSPPPPHTAQCFHCALYTHKGTQGNGRMRERERENMFSVSARAFSREKRFSPFLEGGFAILYFWSFAFITTTTTTTATTTTTYSVLTVLSFLWNGVANMFIWLDVIWGIQST